MRPDPKVVALDEGGKYVEAAIGGALDEGAKECAGSFWKYEDEHFLSTSNGAESHDHRASVYLSIRALVALESSGHGVAAATKLTQFDPAKAGHKAGRIAALARDPKPGKPGRYPVIFDPLICGSLSDQIGGRLSAWAVLAGFSPFGKKIGKAVASSQFTLYDDGSADSIGRKRFDAEGAPTRRNVLVNKGVLTWKDVRLTDNILRMMKNIVALSNKAEQMMWWGEVSIPNFVPYALIKDVGITKSAE